MVHTGRAFPGSAPARIVRSRHTSSIPSRLPAKSYLGIFPAITFSICDSSNPRASCQNARAACMSSMTTETWPIRLMFVILILSHIQEDAWLFAHSLRRTPQISPNVSHFPRSQLISASGYPYRGRLIPESLTVGRLEPYLAVGARLPAVALVSRCRGLTFRRSNWTVSSVWKAFTPRVLFLAFNSFWYR